MDTPSRNVSEDQEIDLSVLSRKASDFVSSFKSSIFKLIQFGLKNILILGILFVLGVVFGYILDKVDKTYESEIIVSPNFNSVDYLYSKVNLVNSKIKAGDTAFLKGIGIKDTKSFKEIEIEPVIDAYKFINNSEQNFELLKLMAEDGDIQKLLIEDATSKNYPNHRITYKTGKLTSEEKTLIPLMNYLNDSQYFSNVKKEFVENVKIKLRLNDSIIKQIDGVLNEFSSSVKSSGSRNDKLVYYNENTQLNDIIKTKDILINEQGQNRILLITVDKIVKDNSSVLNVLDKPLLGWKIIMPFIFIILYLFSNYFMRFYRNQSANFKSI